MVRRSVSPSQTPSVTQSIRPMSNRARTLSARWRAAAAARSLTRPGAAAAPLSSSNPARRQPCVPPESAKTGLGTPALINDWAPMMPRVRPAQETTTRVSGEPTRSLKRRTSSAPGQLIAPGT